jgi:APA family basic amino acid/polyamine antiporter
VPLERVVGLPGAVLLGIGSIVGTGVFVSVGVAGGIAGSALPIAVLLAAVVATCNALSSAQLAAAHPVSGGTYEYGYRWLHPVLGFTAGWTFLCAKSASAATAALGVATYALDVAGMEGRAARVGVAIGVVAVMTVLVAGGLRRSNRANAIIVTVALGSLLAMIASRAPEVSLARPQVDARALLEATALMFVAFAGYARIATLGEEVRDPERTIPRAIIITLVFTTVLYLAVAIVTVSTPAPGPTIRKILAVGACTAMLGVLVNLLLGLSRVALAMARRGDLPRGLDDVKRSVVAVGVVIAAIAAVGDVKTTWSFSAFSVLVYYAITNAAALRLGPEHRRFPRVISAAGLVACLGLAPWVEARVWIVGGALIAVGIAWHLGRRSMQ